MRKYDCTRTLNYVHELNRMCDVMNSCEDCPMSAVDISCDRIAEITEDSIRILQKWSNEHPEMPKLTRKEHDFLKCLHGGSFLFIRRWGNTLYAEYAVPGMGDPQRIPIDPEMFPCVEDGKAWRVDNLIELEVIYEEI